MNVSLVKTRGELDQAWEALTDYLEAWPPERLEAWKDDIASRAGVKDLLDEAVPLKDRERSLRFFLDLALMTLNEITIRLGTRKEEA